MNLWVRDLSMEKATTDITVSVLNMDRKIEFGLCSIHTIDFFEIVSLFKLIRLDKLVKLAKAQKLLKR